MLLNSVSVIFNFLNYIFTAIKIKILNLGAKIPELMILFSLFSKIFSTTFILQLRRQRFSFLQDTNTSLNTKYSTDNSKHRKQQYGFSLGYSDEVQWCVILGFRLQTPDFRREIHSFSYEVVKETLVCIRKDKEEDEEE